MSNYFHEIWAEKRQEWLEERGYTEGDVMQSHLGEYVMDEIEDDECRLSYKKKYLPANLQGNYEPAY